MEGVLNLLAVCWTHVGLLGLDVNQERKETFLVTVVDDTGSAPLATSLGRNPHFEDGKTLDLFQAGIIAWSLFQS